MSIADRLILFDGYCGLCGRFVTFVVSHDHKRRFSYLPLSDDRAIEVLAANKIDPNIDSVLLFSDGVMSAKSTAVLRILSLLGGVWWLVSGLMFLPVRFRDYCYDVVARNRYKIFGKYDTCFIPKLDGHEDNRSDM